MAIILADKNGKGCTIQGKVEVYSYNPDLPLGGASHPYHARGRTTNLEFVIKSRGFGVREFENEVEAYLKMKAAGGCSGILSLVDIIREEHNSYLVLPFIQGQDFYDLLETYSTLSVEALSPILKSLCRMLSFTHGLGIVHGDIKIENVRLERSSSTLENRVYLLDFNSSICSNRFPIKMASPSVTPYYCAPELWLWNRYDQRVDLYALSVLAFNALTGAFPYDSKTDDVGELKDAHLHADIPSAVEINPFLPQRIDRFFEKGLAKYQERRYRTAEELYRGFLDCCV